MYYEDLMENDENSYDLPGNNSIKKSINYYEKYTTCINRTILRLKIMEQVVKGLELEML